MKISIVIPTFNRKRLLEKCLHSLINQDYSESDFEIIICDDGSTDTTEAMVAEAIKSNKKYTIKYLKQSNQGPAVARNMGIDSSKGKVIAFTDDDCQPDRNWLKQIEASFQKGDIVGVGGVTYSISQEITPFTHQIENSERWSFPTCNVAYKRDILIKVGKFDPAFPFTNEDAYISWKMENAGEVVHNSKMKVLHPPRPVTFMKELKSVRYLDSEFLLQKRMPEEYRKRKGSPYREILWVHLVKIGIKKLRKNISWLFRNPFIYLKLIVLIIFQSLYLIYLTPIFALRSRRIT